MRSSRWILSLFAVALLGACRSTPPPEPVATAAAPSTEAAPGWWQDRVFYEIFVRSFADATTGPLANDGIGDFQGLIEKLDYLNDGDPATTTDLGITGLWLMPINPSPSYHGYDVTDYYGVHPQFGTREDFERFLAEAHHRGIRVIVDLVLNHSSSMHPRFLHALRGDPESRDWYIFVPPDEVPATLGPWGQQVWQEKQGQHYLGIFWSGMPDLNYRNPAVTAEAAANARPNGNAAAPIAAAAETQKALLFMGSSRTALLCAGGAVAGKRIYWRRHVWRMLACGAGGEARDQPPSFCPVVLCGRRRLRTSDASAVRA